MTDSSGNSSSLPENYGSIIDDKYIQILMEVCSKERVNPKYSKEVTEGDRLAEEFRKMFANVSDSDLGVFLVVLTRVIGAIGASSVIGAGTATQFCISSYSHAAANIFSTVADLKEL